MVLVEEWVLLACGVSSRVVTLLNFLQVLGGPGFAHIRYSLQALLAW